MNIETLRLLVAQGLDAHAILAIAETLAAPQPCERSAGAKRQARYRERQRNASVTSDVTGDVTGDAPPPAPPTNGICESDNLLLEGNPPPIVPPQPPKQPHRLPQGWQPPAEAVAIMQRRFPNLDMAHEFECFTDYWLGTGKAKLDWLATWRTWIRRSAERSSASVSRPAAFTRQHGIAEQNRQRINEALARRVAVEDGAGTHQPRLRLVEGGD